MDDSINAIKQILDWGLMGFSVFINLVLWRAYQRSNDAHIETLKTVAGVHETIVPQERSFTFPTVGSEMAGPTERRLKLP